MTFPSKPSSSTPPEFLMAGMVKLDRMMHHTTTENNRNSKSPTSFTTIKCSKEHIDS